MLSSKAGPSNSNSNSDSGDTSPLTPKLAIRSVGGGFSRGRGGGDEERQEELLPVGSPEAALQNALVALKVCRGIVETSMRGNAWHGNAMVSCEGRGASQ